MTQHFDEGPLQSWLDGELEGEALRAVEVHLEGCALCRDRAADLRRASDAASRALSALDPVVRPDVDQARWEVRRRWARSRGRGSRRRSAAVAAVLILVAGGVSAVIPGSPIRTWLSSPEPPAETPAQGRTAEAGVVGVAVGFREGRVEVGLMNAAPGLAVEVLIGTGERVEVEAPAGTPFSSGPGRVELSLEGVAGDEGILMRLPAGSGEVLLRTEERLLLRWAGGSFRFGERVPAEPFSGGVRVRVPERGAGGP